MPRRGRAWQTVAEHLEQVRDGTGPTTGNSQCGPHCDGGIEDVINACLLARQTEVIAKDDASPGQQVPAPAHVDLLTFKGAPARQAKLTSG
jgi:hypothetical protein